MWGEPFPVAAAFDDDLVAGVGQPVKSAIGKNWCRWDWILRLKGLPTVQDLVGDGM